MESKRHGISLIMLVITIIVLGILATVTIVSLSNVTVIGQASEAVFKSDISKIKENIEIEKINKSLNSSYTYNNVIPEKYDGILKVTKDGSITYIGDETSQLKEWAEELGIKVVDQVALMHFNKLTEIENLANSYYNAGNKNLSVSVLTTQNIRKNRYTGTSWKIFAGEIDTGFSTYVENNKTQTLFSNNDVFKDPITGANIDFVHQIATLNAYFYDDPNVYDAYAGWAGDLCTVLKQVHDFRNSGTYTKEEVVTYAKSLIGSTGSGSTMDISDTLADIDAANIYSYMDEGDSLSYVMFSYYYGSGKNTCSNRFNLFKDHIEGLYDEKVMVRSDRLSKIRKVARSFLGTGKAANLFLIYASAITQTTDIAELTIYHTAEAFEEYLEEHLEN